MNRGKKAKDKMGENGTSQEKEGKRKRNEITLNGEYVPTQSD